MDPTMIAFGFAVGLLVGITVDMALSKRMAIGSVPGAIAGTIILKKLERDLGDGFDTVIFTLLAIVLWAAAVAHVFAGDIDYGLAGTLLIGAILGILLSTHISLKAPQGAIRGALAVVLLGAGLGMLTKAGVEVPSGLLAIPPVIVIGLVGGAVLRDQGLRGALGPSAATSH